MLQTFGVVSFGSIALAGLYVNPDLGRYILAAGYLGHAAWDVAHHIANKVVPRSYADFCGVVDLLLGFAILFP
jgi:Ni/Fe-hydrogenase subunit HybB-like protein